MRRRQAGHFAPHRRRPGERDHVDPPGHQGPAGAGPALDHLHQPVREAGRFGQFGHQRAGGRGGARRLEHDAAPSRQGGERRLERQEEGEVPWGDHPRHPPGPVLQPGPLVGHRQRTDAAGGQVQVGGAGQVPGVDGGREHLSLQGIDRGLAGLGGHNLDDAGGRGDQGPLDGAQAVASLPGGQRGPGLLAPPGSGDGCSYFGRACLSCALGVVYTSRIPSTASHMPTKSRTAPSRREAHTRNRSGRGRRGRNPRATSPARATAGGRQRGRDALLRPGGHGQGQHLGAGQQGEGHRPDGRPPATGDGFGRRPGHGQHDRRGDDGDEPGADAEGLRGDLQGPEQRAREPGQGGHHPEGQDGPSHQHPGAGPARSAFGHPQTGARHIARRQVGGHQQSHGHRTASLASSIGKAASSPESTCCTSSICTYPR